MNERDYILTELKEISATVAALPRANVYTVDAAYFNGVEEELMARIGADKLYTTQNAFSIPDGYFEGLSNSILDKIRATENNEVLDEMSQLSTTIAAIGNANVYSVSPTYFPGLGNTILQSVNASESNEVLDEMSKLSPTVAGIGNKNVYTAPQGYFDALRFANTEAPVVRMQKQTAVRSFFKYAVAAVVTGLLGISVYTFVNKPLKPNVQTAALMKQADEIIKNNSFDATLESISDKDLEKYLADNGEDVNASLVASTAEDVQLPNAEDYLFDDKTLDNFLNENNLKN
jgi:hypothetical protein